MTAPPPATRCSSRVTVVWRPLPSSRSARDPHAGRRRPARSAMLDLPTPDAPSSAITRPPATSARTSSRPSPVTTETGVTGQGAPGRDALGDLRGVRREVGLRQQDDGLRAAGPGQREQPRDAALVGVGHEALDDGDDVDVRRERLPGRRPARRLGAGEQRAPRVDALERRPAVRPVPPRDAVAGARHGLGVRRRRPRGCRRPTSGARHRSRRRAPWGHLDQARHPGRRAGRALAVATPARVMSIDGTRRLRRGGGRVARSVGVRRLGAPTRSSWTSRTGVIGCSCCVRAARRPAPRPGPGSGTARRWRR